LKLELVVTGVGLISPVGHSALQCMHSVRSGITRLYLQRLQDRTRQWISGGGCMLWSHQARGGYLRALAVHALRQAWTGACRPPAQAPKRVGLLLGAPDTPRPGFRFPAVAEDLESLVQEVGLDPPLHQEIIPAGACSTQLALARADELLREMRIDACIIGAVDSQIQYRVARWHEEHYRLKCSYLEDGLIPGEAAAFLIVERQGAAHRRGARVYAQLTSTAIACERASVLGDAPNTAAGLTAAVAACLKDARQPERPPAMVWSDLNGESYRAREWAFVELRCRLPNTVPLLHPADCHGDLGVATDANLLALATLAQVTGWAQGEPTLVFSGSEGGLRAATAVMAADLAPSDARVSIGALRPRTAQLALPAAQPPDYESSEDPQRDHFQWLLSEEHRDEAAALYYQRRAILNDPELEWIRLAVPEQRLLNHMDAAAAGGTASMASLAAGVESDEEGTVFAGVLALAVWSSDESFERLRRASHGATAAWRAGAQAALTHVPCSPLLERCVAECVAHGEASVRAMGWHLAMHHRLRPPIGVVNAGSNDGDSTVLLSIAEYARRVPHVMPAQLLLSLLQHVEARVRAAAVRALLAIEPQRTLAFARDNLRDDAQFDGALSLALGIGGHENDARALLAAARSESAAAIIAMGVHGDPSLIEPLVAASQSTGEDALRDYAIQALAILGGTDAADIARAGDAGAVREKLRAASRGGLRVRGGRPWTPMALVEALAAPSSPLAARRLALLEFQVWSRAAPAFELDWFVVRQRQAIDSLRQLASR
jgi:3-oxoacyl-[acyl-carrier-protein] synthase I